MDKPTNDNNAFHGVLSDEDGKAALMLVESLIHGLIARSVISVEDAVEIVGIAVDAAEEIESEPEGSQAKFLSSLTMLKAIGQSLSRDL